MNDIQKENAYTSKVQFVDLNDFAFANETGEEFSTQKSLSKKFVIALKANGIRYRPA